MNMRRAFRKKTGKKIKPTEEKSSMGFISVRDFQLHAAVDDIAFQSVQADDLLIKRMQSVTPISVNTLRCKDCVF
jgi:hypothetical protein